jgi:hypothetical protein
MTSFRFALLLAEGSLTQWHSRCLEQLAPFAELAGVIVAPAPERKRAGGPLLRAYARRIDSSGATARVPGPAMGAGP